MPLSKTKQNHFKVLKMSQSSHSKMCQSTTICPEMYCYRTRQKYESKVLPQSMQYFKKVCNMYGNTEMHFYNKYCNNCNISSDWVIERHPASKNPRMPFTNKGSLLKQAMEENCEETNKPSSSVKWTLEQTVPRNDWNSNTPTHTPV